MEDYGAKGASDAQKIDPELQEFLLLEKQKAQVQAQVNLHGNFTKLHSHCNIIFFLCF